MVTNVSTEFKKEQQTNMQHRVPFSSEMRLYIFPLHSDAILGTEKRIYFKKVRGPNRKFELFYFILFVLGSLNFELTEY